MENSLPHLLKVPWRQKQKTVQWILAALFLLTPIWAQAQVSGKILDENSAPIAGVTVVIKGTATGTITDIDGNYTIEAGADQVLVYTYVGYTSQEISVGAQSIIDTQLVLDVTQLEELVVTGYSVERKKDLLGAVAVADMAAVQNVTFPNVLARLQGRMPGVTTTLNPTPGQGAELLIRGRSTLGGNEPLYIVDGVPIQQFKDVLGEGEERRMDLQWLNPNDVESIQVLKDASSASIYGARANNGVVIITTKQASKGKTEISVQATFGVDHWTDFHDNSTSEQRATILWQKAVNDGLDPESIGAPYSFQWHFDPSLGPGIQGNGAPVLDQIIYPDWLDQAQNLRWSGHPQSKWTGTEFGGASVEEGTDWWQVNSRAGIIHDYNVSFSQGGDKGGVRFGVGYFDHKGVAKDSFFKRFSMRLNSNYKFANDKVTIGQNIAVVKSQTHWDQSTGFGRLNPELQVFTEDDQFAGSPGGTFSLGFNPVGTLNDNIDDRLHDVKIVGNVFLDWQIIEGLSFRTNLGIDYDNNLLRDIERTYQYGGTANTIAKLLLQQAHRTNWVWNNTLTYTKTVKDHTFTVLGGTEAIETFVTNFSGFGQEFALETNDYFQLDAASGTRTSGGSSTGYSLYSFFGKANYSFQNKYLASFTVRRDGSSRFGSENRYAVFPAVSVGWRIVNEDFMSGIGWLSDLKLRAAWGQTGNQNILNNARFGLYESLYSEDNVNLPWDQAIGVNPNATSYDIGNNNSGLLQSGFISTQAENQELRWETQTEINVGLDFGFLDDRLIGSFEVYQKTTEDILIQPVFALAIGDGNTQWANGATMETNGWEALVEYRKSTGDWQYSISTNLSHYQDEITELPEELYASYGGNQEQNIIGQSPLAFFGFTTDGLFQNQGEVDAHATQTGAAIGQLRFKDLNNDGVITELDQEFHGVERLAKVQYGINGQVSYRNFDIAIFFYGKAGRNILDGRIPETGAIEKESIPGAKIAANFNVKNLEAWSTVNTGAWIPAQTLNGANFRISDYSWRNGNYFTLRQVTLGYAIPWSVVSALRVYVSGENLFYIIGGKDQRRWTGPKAHIENHKPDPPIDREPTFPRVPRFTLGLNVTF